jgi:hypothetical protein
MDYIGISFRVLGYAYLTAADRAAKTRITML